MDTNGGSGELWTVEADYIGKMGTKSKCTDISDGEGHIRTSRSGKMRGHMATVEDGMGGMKKVCSTAPPPIRPSPPTDFLDVL